MPPKSKPRKNRSRPGNSIQHKAPQRKRQGPGSHQVPDSAARGPPTLNREKLRNFFGEGYGKTATVTGGVLGTTALTAWGTKAAIGEINKNKLMDQTQQAGPTQKNADGSTTTTYRGEDGHLYVITTHPDGTVTTHKAAAGESEVKKGWDSLVEGLTDPLALLAVLGGVGFILYMKGGRK